MASVIAPTVHQLFRLSLDTAALPLAWKQGVIRPFLKGGDPAQPSNYRPMCMTAILVKILEKFVKRAIDRHLATRQPALPGQHGFVQGKSCVTNLLLAREEWCEAMECRQPVHAVFIDFSKAFDRVNHEILLRKLEGFGVSGNVLHWIGAYLTGRTWRVRVQDHLSSARPALSGVPQGSVLGPRLFTIYVSELPGLIGSKCLLYADDLKVWRTVQTHEDAVALQQDLDALNKWSVKNYLPINPAKCSAMVIGRSQEQPQYTFNGLGIVTVKSVRDLGGLVSDDL